METYSAQDATSWSDVVHTLRDATVKNEDSRPAENAAANLSSGAGLYFNLPQPIAALVDAAIQAGYGQALYDVRAGKVDGLGPVID